MGILGKFEIGEDGSGRDLGIALRGGKTSVGSSTGVLLASLLGRLRGGDVDELEAEADATAHSAGNVDVEATTSRGGGGVNCGESTSLLSTLTSLGCRCLYLAPFCEDVTNHQLSLLSSAYNGFKL